MSYLKIENMEIAFNSVKGKFVAVKDINLEVEKGQIISIIGHSGCGKSTIMNAIGGMVFPSKGNVVLNGKAIKGPGPDRGIVFQNYSLLPWLTVYQNIFQDRKSTRLNSSHLVISYAVFCLQKKKLK